MGSPYQCEDCKQETTFERVAPSLEDTKERSYVVSWRCPNCQRLYPELCQVGPLLPTEGSCLVCGEAYEAGEAPRTCKACQTPEEEIQRELTPAEDPVAEAQKDFAKGLYRRGNLRLVATLQREPNHSKAWEERVRFLQDLGFFHAAKTCLEKASSIEGADGLRVSLGVTLQRLGEEEAAVEVYRAFLQERPKSPLVGAVFSNIANALTALEEHAEAETFFRRAIAKEIGNGLHYYNYARALVSQKKWHEAQKFLKAGIAKCAEEERPILLSEAAYVYNELASPEDALKAAEAALALQPKRLSAMFQKGRALGLLGKLAEAREQLQEVLAIEPQNPEAQAAIDALDQALKG